MRLVLAYSALLSAGEMIAQAAGQIPVWLYLAISLLGSGFGGKILLDRRDKRWEQRLQDATAGKSEAETRDIEDRLRKALISQAEAEYARMSEQLAVERTAAANERTAAANLRAQLADARRVFQAKIEAQIRDFQDKLDEKERRMAGMRDEIVRLHDEVAALRAGEDPGKRRLDPPSA